MKKSKAIHDSFIGHKMTNSPYEFIYDNGKNLITVNLHDDKFSIIPANAPRMLRETDVKLIQKWINENNLVGTWQEWEGVCVPVIRLFDLLQSERKELFKKYRESTIKKFEQNIRALEWLIQFAKKRHQYLIEESQYLTSRLKLLKSDLSYFKELNKGSGYNKFLHILIKPLFEKLESFGKNQKQQEQIVLGLFELGKFDNYADTILDNYNDEGLAKIHKIKTETLKM